MYICVSLFWLFLCGSTLLARMSAHPADEAVGVVRNIVAAYDVYNDKPMELPEEFREFYESLPSLPQGTNYDDYPIVYFKPVEFGDQLLVIPLEFGIVVGYTSGRVEFLPSTHYGYYQRSSPGGGGRVGKVEVWLMISIIVNGIFLFAFVMRWWAKKGKELAREREGGYSL